MHLISRLLWPILPMCHPEKVRPTILHPFWYVLEYSTGVFLVPCTKWLVMSTLVKCLHWTSHFLQGTRKTLPCLSGHVVLLVKCIFMLLFAVIHTSSVSDTFHFDMDPDPDPAPFFYFCGNFPWFSLIFCYHDPDQDPFHCGGSGTGWPKCNGSKLIRIRDTAYISQAGFLSYVNHSASENHFCPNWITTANKSLKSNSKKCCIMLSIL